MSQNAKKLIARTFMDIADAMETGTFGSAPTMVMCGLGSELGEQNCLNGAAEAAKRGVKVLFIGTLTAPGVETIQCADEAEGHKIMEEMLKSKKADGAVTMHYPFPIGVSTIGRVVAPASGNPMYLAATTGTSATTPVEAMVRNAITGIATAKACGNENPTVGIINIEGARGAERVLKKLAENGFPINFSASKRADGGAVMRGNDMLMGSADVMVMDSLTGNLFCKVFSSYTSGGGIETAGWGYGPGMGDGFDELVLIVSRASGPAVIANALCYGAELVKGGWNDIKKSLIAQAEKAGLKEHLPCKKTEKPADAPKAKPVEKEVVTAEITGIDVMDLDDAVAALAGVGIYAESAMGCTGPMVLISEKNHDTARAELIKAGYVSE